jgi:hypothetical protein
VTQAVRGEFLDRGYVAMTVAPRAAIDSAAHYADLALAVDPGNRVSIASIEIEGVHSVPEQVVARQLGLRSGDVASRRRIADGRTNLQAVSLFRSADVVLDTVATDATALPLKVRVSEGHTAVHRTWKSATSPTARASPRRRAGRIPMSPAAHAVSMSSASSRPAGSPPATSQIDWGARR